MKSLLLHGWKGWDPEGLGTKEHVHVCVYAHGYVPACAGHQGTVTENCLRIGRTTMLENI